MYYLRTKPKAQAIQFTVDQASLKAANKVAQGEADDEAALKKSTAEATAATAAPAAEKAPSTSLLPVQGEAECLMCGS